MAEIKEDGYIAIRTAIVNNWGKVALQESNNEAVIEIDLTPDNWVHTTTEEQVFAGYAGSGQPQYATVKVESNQEMKIEYVVTGADIDSLPATVNKSVVIDNSGDATREVSIEGFEAFTFESAEDELTITHSIEVPQVI